jgi:hypothetical protein
MQQAESCSLYGVTVVLVRVQKEMKYGNPGIGKRVISSVCKGTIRGLLLIHLPRASLSGFMICTLFSFLPGMRNKKKMDGRNV